MTVYAIVENAVVVNPRVVAHAPLNEQWIEVPPGVVLRQGYRYENGEFIEPTLPSEPERPTLIPVNIDAVAGQLQGYNNADREYTVPQQSADVIATGTLAIEDRKFKVPFLRVDTGRIQLMPAQVVDGVFTVPLKFETNGVWVVNQELINTDFAQPLFELVEHKFSVI